ncbi:radical SAM protein [Clostridiaceae bacterium 35-E11]
MIDFTKLLSSEPIPSTSIRYGKGCSQTRSGTRKGIGPVVVWNLTQKCNYHCKHCYANAYNQKKDLLTTQDILKTIDDFHKSKVPVVLLSGGEPFMRNDLFEIIQALRSKNIMVSISTNGSLINEKSAVQLKNLGVNYVGISLDGTKETHDHFRGIQHAYDDAIQGIENCQRAGLKVGLRFTLQKKNYHEIPYIFDLMDEMNIQRICFYHLVPAGRGKEITNAMLSHEETRKVIDSLYDYTRHMITQKNIKKEILTVTNHVDAIYLYIKSKEKDPTLSPKILELLKRNGGNRSGIAIANIDWEGNVYPDQFSRFAKVGNIKDEGFAAIWHENNPLLLPFRDKTEHLKGKCSQCTWINICNGNLRARAYYQLDDLWAEDPACYLTMDEIRLPLE